MDGQNFQDNQTYANSTPTYYQDNTAQYNSAYSAPPADNGSDDTPGIAIAALVMGIVSIVLVCCCGIGIIFAIAGLIMALVANKNKKSSVGTAALVCSIIGLCFNGISIIYFIVIESGPFLEGFIEGMESL